ncbi:433063c3-00ce-49d6-9c9d-731a03e7f2cf [Thermothielavioides terrestris]|uniref:4-coumarate:coenzyme A ligase n=2 Tax=Thermothielavioides terrestris TaxID=2587410 RepID=G2REB0_THETT|nr:uncharacterized protein THITE_2171462 [Thermothielavioides terrestris NRRL 8126]AEO70939.1 hypothetical protein THITE_2171462 [Thermothielavioides terrestris NRRL 8126]SPQ25065.1 433063c3-00ce-49d6-9c9d-731a03e7f2cf [Thermothielavioides terrestris]
MPVRIPAATRTEVFCMGAAGVSGFAPFYLMAPGAEERLSRQTLKWAPRWERNITMFRNPVERGVQRAAPSIERAVQRLERRLPLERAAKSVDRSIKRNLDRLGIKHS